MARDSLYTHPKFRRLVRELGEPAPHVLGHLETLWHVAYKSGDGLIGDAADVEDAAEWDGDPGRFAEALARHKFVDDLGAGAAPEYHVHDFHDHAPEYVKRKMEREAARKAQGLTLLDQKRKAAAARWAERVTGESDADDHADAEQVQSTCNADTMQTSRPPLKGSEEKRRESVERARARGKFSVPSLEDVAAYIAEMGYTFQPAAFIAHYAARGWEFRRGSPMKDWRQACTTWQMREPGGVPNREDPPARAQAGYAAPSWMDFPPGSPERAAAMAGVPGPAAQAPRPGPIDPPGPYLSTDLPTDRASEGNVDENKQAIDSENDELDPGWISDVDALTGRRAKP